MIEILGSVLIVFFLLVFIVYVFMSWLHKCIKNGDIQVIVNDPEPYLTKKSFFEKLKKAKRKLK